jgi:hypothetical protein
MNPRPISFVILSDLRLQITFQNGEERVFDVANYIQGIPALQRLRDPAFFKLAHLARNTVVWSDNEDICPDTLYLSSMPLQKAA